MLISLNQVPEADVARNKTLFGASEILSRFKVFWFTIGDRHDSWTTCGRFRLQQSIEGWSLIPEKAKIFCSVRFFSSRQFRRIVYSSEIIQNLCFSRILKSISPKHVCMPVKFYRFCQKSKIQVGASRSQPGESHWCKSRQDSHSQKSLSEVKITARASRARARPHAHAHAVYILI